MGLQRVVERHVAAGDGVGEHVAHEDLGDRAELERRVGAGQGVAEAGEVGAVAVEARHCQLGQAAALPHDGGDLSNERLVARGRRPEPGVRADETRCEGADEGGEEGDHEEVAGRGPPGPRRSGGSCVLG